MKLFSSKNPQENYKVLKLFMVASHNQAMKFRTKECILFCMDYLVKNVGANPTRLSLNFETKQYKTFAGFKKGLAKLNDNDIVNVVIAYDLLLASFTLNNTSLNLKKPPELAPIEIQIAVQNKKFDEESNNKFVSSIYKIFKYDYGYIIDLDGGFDFPTERKIRKSLFSQKVDVNEMDSTWRFHMAGVKYGFLKKLYPSNYLNISHLNNPIISSILERGIGQTKKINEKITLWELDLKNLNEANKSLINSKYLIMNEFNQEQFSSSSEAKDFYTKMKF